MVQNDYPSELLKQAIEQFKSLPGIGERTALRLVLFLLKQDKQKALAFGETINNFIEHVQFCEVCYNISDSKKCSICESSHRNKKVICVVENVKDVMSIERTKTYNGVYHVLGGLISPMDGIGPSDLTIDALVNRIDNSEVSEIILATSATMEGETTNFFINKKLKNKDIPVSVIARGVSFGSDLEFTDELTLGKAISNRTPFGK